MHFLSRRKHLRRMSKKMSAKDTLQRLEVGCRLHKWCDDTHKWKLHNFKLKKGQSEYEYYLGYKSKLKQRATFILRDATIYLQLRKNKLPPNKTYLFGFSLKTKKRQYDFIFDDQGEWNLLIPYLIQGCKDFFPKDLSGLLPPDFVKSIQNNEPQILKPIPELQENARVELQDGIRQKFNKDVHPQISQMQVNDYAKRESDISSRMSNDVLSNHRSNDGSSYMNYAHPNNINGTKRVSLSSARSSSNRVYENNGHQKLKNEFLPDQRGDIYSNPTSKATSRSWDDVRQEKRSDNRLGSKGDAYPELKSSALPGLRNDVHQELRAIHRGSNNNIYPDLRKNNGPVNNSWKRTSEEANILNHDNTHSLDYFDQRNIPSSNGNWKGMQRK